jgi:hypothetical protein
VAAARRLRGVEDQPFAEVLHVKNGRGHRHRVYLCTLLASGTAIRLDHEYVGSRRSTG